MAETVATHDDFQRPASIAGTLPSPIRELCESVSFPAGWDVDTSEFPTLGFYHATHPSLCGGRLSATRIDDLRDKVEHVNSQLTNPSLTPTRPAAPTAPRAQTPSPASPATPFAWDFTVRAIEECEPCRQHGIGSCLNASGDSDWHELCHGCGDLADPWEAWTATHEHANGRRWTVTVCANAECLVAAIENSWTCEDDSHGVAAIASRMLADARCSA